MAPVVAWCGAAAGRAACVEPPPRGPARSPPPPAPPALRPPPAPASVRAPISHRLFLLTNALKDAVVPHDDNRRLGRNLVLMGAMMAACTALGFVGHSAIMVWLTATRRG